MLFSDNPRVVMNGLMILLHFVYDVGEYMALRFFTRVLAAFILVQAIFRSSCHTLHIRTWRRRFLHLQGLSLLEFSSLFEQSNTVYVLLTPWWKSEDGIMLVVHFCSVGGFMLDLLQCQPIPDRMLDFASFDCYNKEIFAMPS